MTNVRPAILFLLALFLSSCGGGTVDLPPEPGPRNVSELPTAPANTNGPKNQIRMEWGPGWVVRVRPFFDGQPLKNDVGTVTIDEWNEGPVKLRYEFPHNDFLRNQKEVFAQSQGALRDKAVAGAITIDSKTRSAPVFTPPAFWPGGSSQAPGPTIWVPPSVLRDLKTKRSATLEIEPLPQGLQMATEPGSLKGPAALSLTGADLLGLMVNGQRYWLPVVKAKDDRGSEYIILDSEKGALVLRFEMGADIHVDGKRLKTGANSGYDVMSLDNRGASGTEGQ